MRAEDVAAVLEALRDRLAARLAAPRPAVAAGLSEEALRRAEVALLLERVADGRATAEELEVDLLEALLLLRAARRGSEREPDADAQPVQSRRRSPTPPAPPPPAPPRSPDALALTGPQLRRLRWRVERRQGRFALIPAGVSWEAIVAADSPWLPLVSGRDAGRSDGTLRDASTGRGTRPGTPNGTLRDGTRDADGTLRDASRDAERDAERDASGRLSGRPSPPSHSPLSPEIPGDSEEEEEGAREGAGRGTGRGTLRDGTRDAGRDASTGRGTRDAGRFDGTLRDNPLEVLSQASGGRISPFAAAADQVALATALADLGIVGAELEAFGRALAGDGAARLWPQSEPAKGRRALTVGFFLGRDCRARMLVDGVTRWREAAAVSAEPRRAALADAPVSREESEAALAAARARRAAERAAER